MIARIVAGWPTQFEAGARAGARLQADASFDAIVAAHVADELGGTIG